MHIPQALKHALQNKYIAATVLALTWSVFIHDLGLPFVVREARSLEKAKRELQALETQNEALRQQQADLQNDTKALERFAREHYFMRRHNEEVYRIVD
ncbi:MAG: septum formation initiator family protein [Bacteroidota bacterium]|nr:septum formation initiator family protein [Bacteroidota bacterium]